MFSMAWESFLNHCLPVVHNIQQPLLQEAVHFQGTYVVLIYTGSCINMLLLALWLQPTFPIRNIFWFNIGSGLRDKALQVQFCFLFQEEAIQLREEVLQDAEQWCIFTEIEQL